MQFKNLNIKDMRKKEAFAEVWGESQLPKSFVTFLA